MATAVQTQTNKFSTAEVWGSHATTYAGQVAATTGLASGRLVEMADALSPLTAASTRVLDVGAGTGVLASKVLAKAPGTNILATDISADMIRGIDAQKLPSVQTAVLDATTANPDVIPSAAFSHALSTFMAQFTGGSDAVVAEMFRSLRPGGVVGFGSWTEIAINRPWEIAAKNIRPEFQPKSPFNVDAWKSARDVENALLKAGFVDAHSETTRFPIRFDGAPEEFVEWWFTGNNPGTLMMLSAWEGNVEDVRSEVYKVLEEQFQGGKEFSMEVCLTVARKP